VLVAGSNGKGSTSALLAAIGHAAGYRTGLYTSPHLETVEERLRIDGQVIDGAELAGLLDRIVRCGEERLGTLPTYFEALTVAAFLWFAEQQVDLAVIEVGMGGRLDATNLCDPLLALITSISLEHREHLGDTLGAIAGEKAGIFRTGRPALTWIESPEAQGVVRARAAALGAPLHELQNEIALTELVPQGWHGQRIELRTPTRDYSLTTALLGEHQVHNVALAVRAAELLGEALPRITADAIRQGVAACRWPGRLEPVSLHDGRQVLFDAAHNAEGAEMLARFLARHLDGEIELVFGALDDKDAGEMLRSLIGSGRIGDVVLTAPASSRARQPEELVDRVPADGRHRTITVIHDPVAALEHALGSGAHALLICGSIYLVGELRRELRHRCGVPAAAGARLTAALPYISGS
jgi:dihydrofolate synthase/folylpolyglutamate synthase